MGLRSAPQWPTRGGGNARVDRDAGDRVQPRERLEVLPAAVRLEQLGAGDPSA